MHYLKEIVLLLLGSFSCAIASAQISGYVYDVQSGHRLPGTTLFHVPTSLSVQSDESGHFQFPEGTGKGEIEVSLLGYKSQSVQVSSENQSLNIQREVQPTTLTEVRISSLSPNLSVRETAGAISIISKEDLERGTKVSLQPALNRVAGVKMDQSNLSEARISIRGAGVRSGYGLRNIKVYVNEIPVTEVDGTTRIEALDVSSMGQLEVIKGPASSIYGAGNAGVLNVRLQRAPYREESVTVSSLSGNNGLQRLATTYRSGGEKLNSFISYGEQNYQGYREHNSDKRRFLTGNFQLFPSDNRTITFLINRTSQDTQIPGALTADQVLANPQQGNVDNIEKQAARYQNWSRIGIAQQYRFNERFENSTSAFTYFYDLDHPLSYAYLKSFYQSYGGRTRFNYQTELLNMPTALTWGMELTAGLTKGTQYVNNAGQLGAQQSDHLFDNLSYSLFLQSNTKLTSRTELAAGISYNRVRYRVENFMEQSLNGTKDFKPQFSPRLALSHVFSNALSVHASVSTGFSPPTVSEIKNEQGLMNQALRPELAVNYEWNVKGALWSSRLNYDLAVYRMDMRDELIGQAVQQGLTIYHNIGKTTHKGLEVSLAYQAVSDQEGWFTSIYPYAAVTYSDFRFRDYKRLNADGSSAINFSGNEFTGVAPWVVNAGIDVETKLGAYFQMSYFFNDKTPANDENTVYNGAYQVSYVKLGYQQKAGKRLRLAGYAGVDNLFNRSYSSMISLNAVSYGPAAAPFFNPSPRRTLYFGVDVKYLFAW